MTLISVEKITLVDCEIRNTGLNLDAQRPARLNRTNRLKYGRSGLIVVKHGD